MEIKHTTNPEQCVKFIEENLIDGEYSEVAPANRWGVAIEDGHVVGVIGVDCGRHANRIRGFFVLKDYRRRGIGTALLHDLLQTIPNNIPTGTYCNEVTQKMLLREGFTILRPISQGFGYVAKNMKQI